ncbi:MAG: hypothetical protein WB629_02930, partial [Candidatus Sulfotelmatobacter sp.]
AGAVASARVEIGAGILGEGRFLVQFSGFQPLERLATLKQSGPVHPRRSSKTLVSPHSLSYD